MARSLTECQKACEFHGSPTPCKVREALNDCVMSDLRIVLNMLSVRCVPARRATNRKDLLIQVEQRISACERLGEPPFTARAVGNMLASADLSSKAKSALQLRHSRQRADCGGSPTTTTTTTASRTPPPAASRVYPLEGECPGGSLPLAQLTVPELFARRYAGDVVRGAVCATPLSAAMAELPFYEIKRGLREGSRVFDVQYGKPHALGPYTPRADRRVLLFFVAAPPVAEVDPDTLPTVGGVSYLAWPPASSTVRVGDKVLARRGKAALPIDITSYLTGGGARRPDLSVTGAARPGVPLLGMQVVVVECWYDHLCAAGDVSHFFYHHAALPQRAFVPKRGRRPQDDALEFGFYRVPLACPLSAARMAVPVRTATCNHVQCFDLGSLLMAGAIAGVPRWKCPVCSEPAALNNLEIDPVVQHALAAAPVFETVDISGDGLRWREITAARWRDPEAERIEAAAALAQASSEFWQVDLSDFAPTPHEIAFASASADEFTFASAGAEPVDSCAEMAFWMDLAPLDTAGVHTELPFA